MAALNTRKAIRRRVGRLTGDLLLCTATSNGLTTTFVDALNLSHEEKILIARQGIFSGGSANNLGRVVRVTANVKSTQTLTFTPSVPSATAIGDELELWNERDEGVTPAAVHDLINDAIKDVTEGAPVPVTSDTLTFNFASPVIEIDELEVGDVVDGTNWEAVVGIDWRLGDDDENTWQRVDRADLRVDRYARTIEIRGRNRWLCDTNLIRVRGANLPQDLTTDAATTSVNFEWLTHQVAANALGIRLEKAYDRREVEGRMLQLQQRADQLRPRINLRLRGAMWRLS